MLLQNKNLQVMMQTYLHTVSAGDIQCRIHHMTLQSMHGITHKHPVTSYRSVGSFSKSRRRRQQNVTKKA